MMRRILDTCRAIFRGDDRHARLLIAVAVACVGLGAQPGVAGAAPMTAWAPIASTGPTVIPPVQNATQDVAVVGEGGSFTLTFKGQTTAALPFNATEKEVAAALDGLSSIGGVNGSVLVTGGPGGAKGAEDPYVVVFEGALAGKEATAITANSSALTGAAKGVTVTSVVSGGPGTSTMDVFIQNVGGAASSGEITLTGSLPPGILLNGSATTSGGWSCINSPDAKSFTCKNSTLAVKAGTAVPTPLQPLMVEPGASGTGVVHIVVSGGGAVAPGTFEMPLTVSSVPAGQGFQSFTGGAYTEEGVKDTRAGGHPFAALSGVLANTVRSPEGKIVPAGEFRDIKVSLPPGFFGNPVATPRCPANTPDVSGAEELNGTRTYCPANTIVGIAQPGNQFGSYEVYPEVPVVNVESPIGYPAEFKFNFGGEPIHVIGSLRSDDDYGIDVESPNTPQIIPVYNVFFTFWGTPASHAHDSNRCATSTTCGPSTSPEVAFLTSPTNCAEEAATAPFARLTTNTWELPEEFEQEDIVLPPVTGCENLHFEGQFGFQPDEAVKSDSPTGFSTDIEVPVEGLTDPNKRITPELKKVVATLPAGVTVNPSAAGGLGACSEEQIGFEGSNFAMPNPMHFNENPNKCPNSSKIGTVELKTSLLEETLEGALYLAAQGNGNPFGSLFAVYLVIENPRNGVYIKLPGELEANKSTGQLQATFDNLPQLPFTSVRLQIEGGSSAPLATPSTCGTYATQAEMTPWSAPESGPPFESTESFTVNNGPNGTACAATPASRPFAPTLKAGTGSTTAGAFTPFVVKLSRNDGEQELGSVEVNAPPGFLGVLTGIPYCSEAAIKAAEASTGVAEQQNPSCPTASELGSLTAAVGAGSTPFYASGKAYLAGPYEGQPFSIVFVTPAVAGPFDLGDVVVRATIHVNPETAQISVKTDAIPQIVDGVPLQVRSIEANINRPNFGLNPTSCEKLKITSTAHGASGATATPSVPFQVGGCAGLAFSPSFAVSTQGKTSRADGASLTVKVAYPQQHEANIRYLKVELPKQLPSRLTTLQKACTDAQFVANPAGCPAASVLGTAVAVTPVLNQPLTGPAYFVSHGGAAFPDLEIVLQGEGVTVVLDGSTFISKQGITSTTFNTVPDAPISSFQITLPQGPDSALAANGNLCTSKLVMPTTIIAQNNKEMTQQTQVAVTGCKPSIAVTSHKVKGKTVTIQVRVPSAGKLVASGNGLSKASKKASKASIMTVKLKLSKKEQAFLNKHKGRKLKSKINLTFMPTEGAKLKASVTVLVR